MCGDDFPGDGGHVPRYHQRDDVPYWKPCPAYRGISKLHRASTVDVCIQLFYFGYFVLIMITTCMYYRCTSAPLTAPCPLCAYFTIIHVFDLLRQGQ